jgi:hypothetical protein
MSGELVERARAVEGIAPNGSLISDMADEIECLSADYKRLLYRNAELEAEAKWDLSVKVAQAERIAALEKECLMHKNNDDLARRANQIWADKVAELEAALKCAYMDEGCSEDEAIRAVAAQVQS